jgi:hypothetical protein
MAPATELDPSLTVRGVLATPRKGLVQLSTLRQEREVNIAAHTKQVQVEHNTLTFTWSGPRCVDRYTEAIAVGEAVMPTGPLWILNLHDLPRISNHVGTVRGSFETMPAGPDCISDAETWLPALPRTTSKA